MLVWFLILCLVNDFHDKLTKYKKKPIQAKKMLWYIFIFFYQIKDSLDVKFDIFLRIFYKLQTKCLKNICKAKSNNSLYLHIQNTNSN